MEKRGKGKVSMSFFFSGSHSLKLDEKGRFVLPQPFRLGLVEEGKLEFVICLGMGKSLSIYKRSDIEKIVKKLQQKQHVGRLQPFFTTFFSTMHQTTCDRLGRVMLPSFLRQRAEIQKELVVCGVLDKIEIWSEKAYSENLGKQEGFTSMMEEAFLLLEEKESIEKEEIPKAKLTEGLLSKVGTELC